MKTQSKTDEIIDLFLENFNREKKDILNCPDPETLSYAILNHCKGPENHILDLPADGLKPQMMWYQRQYHVCMSIVNNRAEVAKVNVDIIKSKSA